MQSGLLQAAPEQGAGRQGQGHLPQVKGDKGEDAGPQSRHGRNAGGKAVQRTFTAIYQLYKSVGGNLQARHNKRGFPFAKLDKIVYKKWRVMLC